MISRTRKVKVKFMADEQDFMKDLYKTIIEGTDLYNPDGPYGNLEDADPVEIYECIDGKVDAVLDFTVEYFVGKDDQIPIKDIRQIKTLIQSDTWEDACLSIAKHVDETRLDGAYSELLSKLEDVVDLYHGVNRINDILDDLNYGDEQTKRNALKSLGNEFLNFGEKLSSKLPPIVSDIVGFQFQVGAKLLNDGAEIIENHISQIEAIEREVDEILNGNQKEFDFSQLESVKNGLGIDAQIAEIDEIIAIHQELKKAYDIINSAQANEISQIINSLNSEKSKLRNYHSDFETLVNALDFSRKYNFGGNKTDKIDKDKLRDNFENWQNNTKNRHNGDYPYINPPSDTRKDMEKAAENTGNAENANVDPLVLDLNKDGFDIETKKFGAHFDLNCDGFAEKINWTRKDAILALDKNHNGLIDDGSELFGDYHLLADGSKAKNGFEALAQYDTNNDGVIDENDEIFDQLRLWIDENGDGVSDQGELKSLKDMHIKAINLDYAYVNQPTGTEALIGNVATFVYDDDTVGNIGEMWMSSDLYDAIEKVIVGVTDMTDGLPNVRSYGKVNSLHAAIAMDETGKLKSLVENFVSETDNDTRLAIVEDILHFICHTEDVEDGSRGAYVDAKNLAVIEALMGKSFMGVNGENPNSAAAPILNRVYGNLIELYCFAMIGSQITEHLDYIKADIAEDGTRTPYMEYFNKHIYYGLRLGTISGKTFSDVCSYLGYYGSNIENDYRLFTEFRTYIEDNAPQYLDIVDASVFGAIRDSEADNSVKGTTVADMIYGNGGNDTINGDDGNDLLFGGDGNDAIYGDGGNDTLYGENGNDVLNGGNGNDFIYGDAGNDSLYGNYGNDILDGGDGDDYLSGGEDNDTYIYGKGSGNDTIYDCYGMNRIKFVDLMPDDLTAYYPTSGYDAVLIVASTGETLTFKDFRYSGSYRNFNLEFADGTTLKVNETGSPFLHIVGTNADDKNLISYFTNSTIEGLDGNDTLNGANGVDMIYGGAGNDSLYGNYGNDVLDGGEGDDYLSGGEDNDTYIYGKGSGNDTIYDCYGMNRIKFVDLMPDDLTAYYPTSGYDAVLIVASTGETLTFKDFRYSGSYRNFELEFDNGRTGFVNYERGEIELYPLPDDTDEITETEEGPVAIDEIATEEQTTATDIIENAAPITPTDDDIVQSGADILDELYADDNSVSELLMENDNTVISEIADSASTSDENENTADQIDVQVMILTENMAAFSNESNISDSMNMQSGTDSLAFADQLLVGTQAS